MSIVAISNENCINCNMCVTVCPLDVLRQGDKKPEIAYPGDCQTCYLCRMYCQNNAITVNADRARASIHPW